MRKKLTAMLSLMCSALLFCSCGTSSTGGNYTADGQSTDSSDTISYTEITDKVKKLESGLSAVKFEGDNYFSDFLSNGGAKSDSDVVDYLMNRLSDVEGLSFFGNPFGCSTISVADEIGNHLFGRNFDWNKCNALILHSIPTEGYSSISTINTDFIAGIPLSILPDNIQGLIACYAALDGMNEKGLCVSVNMIQDSATINQNTDKPDITTTTAIRLLLDNAATTDEAVEILSQYDMHASMNYMVHFAIADSSGKSVCVEYIDNEMSVVETPVVTNFYLTEGDKYGIGTSQSKERYDLLTELMESKSTFTMYDVRDALDSVSKDNFDGFDSTEWSIVYNQSTGEVHYYHREDYSKGYNFKIETS